MNPLIHESKDFDITINYSDEAVEKELFKFKVKTKNKTFEIPADLILEMVANNFKQKEVAVALLDTEQQVIPAVEAVLPVHFVAPKDYKQGDIIQFTTPMVLPAFMAHVMQAFKLAMLNKDNPITQVPYSFYEKAMKEFEETNSKFIKAFWGKEVKETSKENTESADTSKAE